MRNFVLFFLGIWFVRHLHIWSKPPHISHSVLLEICLIRVNVKAWLSLQRVQIRLLLMYEFCRKSRSCCMLCNVLVLLKRSFAFSNNGRICKKGESKCWLNAYIGLTCLVSACSTYHGCLEVFVFHIFWWVSLTHYGYF